MVTRVEFMHLLLLLCAPVIYDHVVQEQQNPRSALLGVKIRQCDATQALRATAVGVSTLKNPSDRGVYL